MIFVYVVAVYDGVVAGRYDVGGHDLMIFVSVVERYDDGDAAGWGDTGGQDSFIFLFMLLRGMVVARLVGSTSY